MDLPPELSNLRNLKRLVLSKNEFRSVPSVVESFKNLRELDVRLNRLKSWPSGINKMEKLQMLDLSFNELPSIQFGIMNSLAYFFGTNPTKGISFASSLTSLNLSYNNLQEFPTKLFEFTELRHLNLSSNNLKSVIKNLPPSSSSCSSLSKLNISNKTGIFFFISPTLCQLTTDSSRYQEI